MKLSEKIAQDLQLDRGRLQKIINGADFYYKRFTIPKKNGGTRVIMQASPDLKRLQYWVRENILKRLPVSNAAFAYGKGDSVKRHAQFHIRSNYILHADIRRFFPSVNSEMLIRQLKKYPDIFTALNVDLGDALSTISKICFRKNRLCIGTVSSPAISNIVMYDFDRELIAHCNGCGCLCSRYADDIYISSQSYISYGELHFLNELLKKYGFGLNAEKTYFASKKGRRSVTGIIVTDDCKLSVGLERKTEIKKMLYEKLVHGRGDSEKILGHLAFLKDVEPRSYDKIIAKYAAYCGGNVLKELKKN